MKINQSLTLVTVSDPPCGGIELFDIQSAAEASGMHPEMILEFLRAGVVSAVHQSKSGDYYFDDLGIRHLRQIESLRTDQSLSLHVICLLMRLLNRAEAAEGEVRRLREFIR